MSASQDGRTPRRTTRRATATPVRDLSPPTNNLHAASTTLQTTPAIRRSTRANSRRPDQVNNAVNNVTLPEIQTRQSYAYGSSKTPLLPEQLQARDSMTIRQVADQMTTAIHQAEQNLGAHAADVEGGQREPQLSNSKAQSIRRTSKEPSPPVSVTTEVQKKQRTAAWASSLEGGQLEDIPEEEQPRQVDTPETRRTEQSSFPSGIFDQSYQYERGLRPPHRPPKPTKTSFGAKLDAMLDYTILTFSQIWQGSVRSIRAASNWLARLFSSIFTVILDLPDSKVVSALAKTFFIAVLCCTMSYVLCFGYSQYLCDPSSNTRISQTLQSWCGTCQTTRTHSNISSGSDVDAYKITSALKHIDSQIRNVESRINLRIDSQVAAIHTDIDSLRKEQSDLVEQLENVSGRTMKEPSSSDVASPLIPKINYFSPANGAIVDVRITSPTRQAPMSMAMRVAWRMLGIQKYKAYNPIKALEPWQDIGECWCAAATAPDQDSIRLGVSVREHIFPTELVIEHPPQEISLTPETAPKMVELWADFSHLSNEQLQDLAAHNPRSTDSEQNPFGKNFGLLGAMEYQLASEAGHIQTFALNVNKYGDLKYPAQDYALRVRSTYGGEFGCLYRVRLHGMPVEKTDGTADTG